MMIKLKRNDKIGLVFFLAFIISMSLVWLFEERFDQEQWRSNPGKRYKMAKNIIEQDLLDNKSKEEVIQILGEPVTAEFSDNNILISLFFISEEKNFTWCFNLIISSFISNFSI